MSPDTTEPNGEQLQLPSDLNKSWESLASIDLSYCTDDDGDAQSIAPVVNDQDVTVNLPRDSAGKISNPIEPGTTLILSKKIGTGGFGEVWEAVQARLGRAVAVKKVRVDLWSVKDPKDDRHKFIDENLRQEALIAASLDHPNIVPVYDLQDDERGFPALAMKLVRGRAWDDVIKQDTGNLSRADFLAKHIPILIAVSQAVAFAHSRSIIHRDLKPAQVMIGDFGEVLLMDWGLGMVHNDTSSDQCNRLPYPDSLPRPQSASNPAGTLAYMAPEQTQPTAENIGPWTDVFLLGGILYYLLSGASPHWARTSAECFELAKAGKIVPLRERASDVDMPQELVELCELSLKPEITTRPQDAKEFLDRLQAYHSGSARRQQSLDLTEQARQLLTNANGDYGELSVCDDLLDRAIVLWPDNKETIELSYEVSTAFAQSAIKNEDLQLARMLVSKLPDTPAKQTLVGAVNAASDKRRKRERQRRIATISTITALVVIVVGGIYYNRLVSQEHQAAVVARSDAEGLIAGMQDNLFEELQSAGQVKVLQDFLTQVDSYFTHLDASAFSRDTRVRHLASILALQQTHERLGDTFAANADAERAMKMAVDLLAAKPSDPLYLAMAARSRARYAEGLFQAGDQRDKALEVAHAAAANIDTIHPSRFADLQSGIIAARTAQDLSEVFLFMEGDTTTAAKLLSDSRSIHEHLLAIESDNLLLLDGKAKYLLRVAELNVATGKLQQSLDALNEALSIRNGISQKEPANLANKADIARTQFWIGRTYERLGETSSALTRHEEVLHLREGLSAQDPADVQLRWEAASSRVKVAELEFALGDTAGADTDLSASLAILSQVRATGSEGHEFRLATAGARLVKGEIQESRGNITEAREEWTQAAVVLQKLEKFAPYEFSMLRLYAETLLRLDRIDEAKTVMVKLRHLGYKGATLSKLLTDKGLPPL